MKSVKFSFDFLTYSIWGVMALTVLSGIFLAVYYVPAFSQAFPSLQRINEQIPFGWMFRRIHAVGASFLLLLLLLHLLRVFYAGVYKSRPGRVWMMEVFLVFFILWTNFTGSFLPLSQEAFWGTAATLSSLSSIPWIGNFLVEFIRGGRELGGAALERFFSMHIGFAALAALLLFRHSRWGIPESGQEGKRSLGLNLWTGAGVAGLLLGVVTLTPSWFTDPLKVAANPTVNPEVASFPWYFLFLQETLSFFNAAYPVVSGLLWGGTIFLLLALPFIDRNPERNFLLRPVSLSLGSALGVVLLYFTFLGLANAHYGDRVILPEDPVSSAVIRGARVFSQRNCAYCHQVFGREGRREGPDMAVVVQRGRTQEWLQRFILNPRLYQPGTTMPRYDIPLQDLEDLSAYLLSLDPKKRKFQIVDRDLLLSHEPFMGTPGRK